MCSVYGTSTHSLFELSDALVELGITHTITEGRHVCTKGPGNKQRKPVYLFNRVNCWRPESVNFIVASVSELSLTNFARLRGASAKEDVEEALTEGKLLVPKVNSLGDADYINCLAKPSLLNKIQTEVYRIQPYSLRKSVQALVLDFFNSRLSVKAMQAALQDNLKCDTLRQLLVEALYIRDAVTRLDKEDLNFVSVDTSVPTFELLYLSKLRKKK